MSEILESLSAHILNTGGVPVWAAKMDIAASTLYAKLNGTRRIFPEEAAKFEKLTKGRFTKEKIIFGSPS